MCAETKGLWARGCVAATEAQSVNSQLKLCIERLIESERSRETLNTSHFSLSLSLFSQIWGIWLLFLKVKSNSSLWFVSELIMMINWLSS